ncbi:hypothetical protein COOONC_03029 [Cooperia oncophora]
MLDLNKHLEAESNGLEISVIQWLTRIDFRKEELLQQTALLTTSQATNSQSVSSGASNCQEMLISAMTPQERNIQSQTPTSKSQNNHPRPSARSQALLNMLPRESSTAGPNQPASNQHVLQTASALIFDEAEMDYQPINVLLDSGAQRSFVSADEEPTMFVHSQLYDEWESSKKLSTPEEVVVTLKSLHSSKKIIRQPVHTKEKLTAPTWTAELSRTDKCFISQRNLTIAQHTLESTEVTPDLIIGQDILNQYATICYDAPTIILPSGLILTPTIFGYDFLERAASAPQDRITESLESLTSLL